MSKGSEANPIEFEQFFSGIAVFFIMVGAFAYLPLVAVGASILFLLFLISII